MQKLARLNKALYVSVVMATSVLSESVILGSDADIFHSKTIESLKNSSICEVARRFDIPPALIAGIILAEYTLNRGLSDRVQDALFDMLVAVKNEKWWEDWATQGMRLVDQYNINRLVANQWPIDVVGTGFVYSIGPAQITPRTAIIACADMKSMSDICNRGVKKIVEELLKDDGAIEIAAVILQYERQRYLRVVGKDVAKNTALWASLYNFGVDYYLSNFAGNEQELTNQFGRWVRQHQSDIDLSLRCKELKK